MTQTEKILTLLRQGLKAAQIAERVGCSRAAVYIVASRNRISTKSGKDLDIAFHTRRAVELHAQGVSIDVISERLGMKRSAVKHAIGSRHVVASRMAGAADD